MGVYSSHTKFSCHIAGSSKYQPGSNSSLNTSGRLEVCVQSKDGDDKIMTVQRPSQKLNPRFKPEVVVKRKEGKYETGRLMFLGPLDGKEMAGIELALPSKCR